MHLEAVPKLGTIALVGAGPGNPDLLTIEAARLLREAGIMTSVGLFVSYFKVTYDRSCHIGSASI